MPQAILVHYVWTPVVQLPTFFGCQDVREAVGGMNRKHHQLRKNHLKEKGDI